MQTDLTYDEWNKKTISKQVRDEHYKELQNDELRLFRTQKLLYDAYCDNPGGLCDKAASEYIEMVNNEFLPVSSICGRRNELITMGIVAAAGTVQHPDHNNDVRNVTNFKLTTGGFSH